MLTKVNLHNIDLLEGMTVVDDGMWESIAYKGWSIYTQDMEDISGPYKGTFVVENPAGDMLEFANLGQVKIWIDNNSV